MGNNVTPPVGNYVLTSPSQLGNYVIADTLTDGSVVDVWVDSVEGLAGPEDQRDLSFGNLMDIAPADQDAFDVTATTPADPGRVVVTVARFPRSSVFHIASPQD
jgi:hypothetical protein